MLTSISNFQPAEHGGHFLQHSFADQKNNINDLKDEEKKTISQADSAKKDSTGINELSQEQQLKVQQLKQRDIEVKSHEQAHLSAAGSLATGGASFTYTNGPDGIRYATGGEVGIDTSPVSGDPAATIRKAEAIRRAALAPASPSSQDQLVASNATAMAETARAELIQQTQEEKKVKEVEKDQDTTEKNKFDTTISFAPDLGTLIDLSV